MSKTEEKTLLSQNWAHKMFYVILPAYFKELQKYQNLQFLVKTSPKITFYIVREYYIITIYIFTMEIYHNMQYEINGWLLHRFMRTPLDQWLRDGPPFTFSNTKSSFGKISLKANLYCSLDVLPAWLWPLRRFFLPPFLFTPATLPWAGPPPRGVSLLEVASETEVEPMEEVSSRSSNSSENSSSSSESRA